MQLTRLVPILVFSVSILILILPGLRADEEATEAVLKLELRFPVDAKISDEAVFWGRLWEYDSFLADASAKEVDSVEIHVSKFTKGADGVVKVSTLLKAPLQERRKYYVTVRVYPDATKDESSDRFFLDGFNKVFEDGKGQTLEAELKPPR